MLKTCSKCKAEKDCSEFSKDAAKKDGLRSSCRECWSEYNKARRSSKEAKEKAAAYAAEHYSKPENKARHAAHMAGYFRRNRDAYAARGYRWRLNPENAAKVRAYNSRPDVKLANSMPGYRRGRKPTLTPGVRASTNRLAMKKRAGGKHTAADIKQLFPSPARQVRLLPRRHRRRLSLDHIQPLALGGRTDKTNLQLLCPTCNLKKGAKPPERWAAENGRLL